MGTLRRLNVSNRPVHSLSFAVLAQRLQKAGGIGHGGGHIRMAAAQLHDLQTILSSQPKDIPDTDDNGD